VVTISDRPWSQLRSLTLDVTARRPIVLAASVQTFQFRLKLYSFLVY
jgi:hypothetical protein